MSIATKKGDGGRTDGPGGIRISKADPFPEIVGTLDELNAVLGLCRQDALPLEVRDLVKWVQHVLLDLGASLYLQQDRIKKSHVKKLEKFLEANEPELDTFILPSNHLHLARAICRRLERNLVEYAMFESALSPETLKFINRLSDALYAAAIISSSTMDRWESQA